MIFNWFRKPPPAYDDRVWLDCTTRTRAIVAQAKAAQTPLVLVAFFPATLDEFAQALRAADVPFAEVGPARSLRPPGLMVQLTLADRVAQIPASQDKTLQFCAVEHHPLPEPNAALVERLARLGPARPVFHSALDEPLMRHFGGERVAALMRKMDMPADEAIAAPMVTSALANAREKVRKKVVAPLPAKSMGEWLAINLPP
ncbi:MAG: hypothetical protein HY902_13175 [Deltaproteobacteria bacterium]|nr:hypothetical protein [Deltaproteobacteria bacterium]